MISGSKNIFKPCHNCTYRDSTCQTFSSCNHIRHDFIALRCKKLSTAINSGLHFINHKQNIFFFEQFSQSLNFTSIKRGNAALPLHKLQKHCTSYITNFIWNILNIFSIDKAIRKRSKIMVHFTLGSSF